MRYLGGGIGHLEQFSPPHNDVEDADMNDNVAELESNSVSNDDGSDDNSDDEDKGDCDEAGGNEDDDTEFFDEEIGNVY